MTATINGYVVSAAKKIIDGSATGFSEEVGPFGELMTGYKIDDVSVQFQYDYINTEYEASTTTTGDGNIATSNSVVTASSASNGTAIVQSLESIRYRPGHSGFIDFTASFSGSGVAFAGAYDANDGFLIKYDNGTLSFGYRQGGTDTLETIDLTNLRHRDGSSISVGNLNIWRIWFGYLGIASPALMIKAGDWTPVHVVDTEGQSNNVHVRNPVFPMRVEAQSGATVKTACWNGGTIGGHHEPGRPFAFPNTALADGVASEEQGAMVLTSTNVGTALILQGRSTYQSKTNKVKAVLRSMMLAVDPPGSSADGEIIWQLVKDATLSGAASYTDVSTNHSVLEYDHTASTGASVEYASGGTVLATGHMYYYASTSSKTSSQGEVHVNGEDIGAYILPGETICLLFKDRGGNGVTVRFSLNWEEMF